MISLWNFPNVKRQFYYLGKKIQIWDIGSFDFMYSKNNETNHQTKQTKMSRLAISAETTKTENN